MPQDAFTLNRIAQELDIVLKGSKVNKVTQPNKDEIELLLYTGKSTERLVISASACDCRVSFTENEKKNPSVAPNFCMLLRKYLPGASIENIKLFDFERIIDINFICKNEFMENIGIDLMAEIMGKYSNIVLIQGKKILGALKQSSLDLSAKRILLSGYDYSMPPPQDKLSPLNKENIQTILQSFGGGDLGKHLFIHLSGIASVTANEAVAMYFGKNDISLNELIIPEFSEFFFDYLFSKPSKACIALYNGKEDFFVYPPKNILSEYKKFDTLLSAQMDFYDNKIKKNNFFDKANALISKVNVQVKKSQKRKQIISERLQTLNDTSLLKEKADLISTYAYSIKPGANKCVLNSFYDNGEIEIQLDIKLSAQQNAQRYYNKYQKQKRALISTKEQFEYAENELNYFDSLISELNYAVSEEDLEAISEEMIKENILTSHTNEPKNRIKRAKPREYLVEGFTVRQGKSNIQNDELLIEANRNDIWLHTKNFHSSHVIIESCGNNVPPSVILAAAEICAYYSKAQNSNRIPVDYCLRKFVKKIKGAKPGNVTYTDFKTVIVDPNKHDDLIV